MSTLWRNAKLATMAGDSAWGWCENGAILTEGERITWVGSSHDLSADLAPSQEVDLQGAVVTPGLVDCHTHLVYGGQRAHEFELRLQGASYEEIARAGGGIRSSVNATREATFAQLLQSASERARCLMAEGVTTLEVKSGYGLSYESEAACLQVARALGKTLPLNVRSTFLGLHAVPPEFQGRGDEYVESVCAMLPQLHAQGLVDAVDAFCEGIGFSVDQTQRVFAVARTLGLPVKLHAEQLSDLAGTQLACSFGALSCDHLEHVSDAGVQAMAASGTVAVLLPGAYYFLRETKLPPIAALRKAGVPMAIATDHNPGTSPTLSLLLMLNMACTLFRLTPEEALRGVTVHAAKALGLQGQCGQLQRGLRADFVVWGIDHPNELAYYFGRNPCRQVVFGGVERQV